jgi:hypothetical protein
MHYIPLTKLPKRKEPVYAKRWKDQPEPVPKYSPAWIRWKQANFSWMSLKQIAQEASMGRLNKPKE